MNNEKHTIRKKLNKIDSQGNMVQSSLANKGLNYAQYYIGEKKVDIMKFYLCLATDKSQGINFSTDILVEDHIDRDEIDGYTIIKSDTIKANSIKANILISDQVEAESIKCDIIEANSVITKDIDYKKSSISKISKMSS